MTLLPLAIMSLAHPRVFLCHAHEDKDRFVIAFATDLRRLGIEVWLDTWEIRPGDPLVERIFDDGIRNSDAMIAVVSRHSVNKPWVKEELSAGVVRKIRDGIRLIPIILDDVEVPQSLSSTLWVKIRDLSNFVAERDEVVATIYQRFEKPPLGPVPEFAECPSLPGLQRQDVAVLLISCEAATRSGSFEMSVASIHQQADQAGISHAQLQESLQMLAQNALIEATVTNRGIALLRVRLNGFELYAQSSIEGYDEKKRRVASAILNKNLHVNGDLAETLGLPRALIDHTLLYLERDGCVKLDRALGGHIAVLNVLPGLKRMLQ